MAPKRSDIPSVVPPHTPRRPGRQLLLGARLLGVSTVAGAVLAAVALPAVGGLGLGAKAAADDFNNLPGDLVVPTLSQASKIYDADNDVIATVYSRDRTVVPISKIAPVMQNALVDIEDHRFYQHGAIDLQGTLRALLRDGASGGVSQGGSTLTQQYVKNVFIEEAGDSSSGVADATRQTLGRKIQELKYAIALEQRLSKQQILDNYLNITYFGGGAYGVEAAAQLYFSVHASQLTLPQAALLAGLVQSPSAYDPVHNPAAALTRRNEVLDAMATYGTISKAQAAQAKATSLGLRITVPKTGCIAAKAGDEFFCNYVEHVLLDDPAFGATAQARQALFDQGGLRIHTTLSPKDQAAEEQAMQAHISARDSAVAVSSMVQPGTGQILAMAQSRPFGTGTHQTEINYNVNGLQGGGEGFQTGSVFKAVTAATALSEGYPLGYQIDSPASADYPAMTDCNGVVHPAVPGDQNDTTKPYGKINMVQAMAASVNTYFVPLEQQAGLCNVVHMAQSLGLGDQGMVDSSGTALTPLSQAQSLTLGVNDLTPLQIADAYAAFADNGTYCSPTALTSVVDAAGKSLPVPSAGCHQVLSPSVAQQVNTLLHSVVSDQGTGATIAIPYSDAGKTGTTNSEAQAWFAGYTSELSDATVVTDPNHPTRTLNGVDIGGHSYDPAYGYLTSGPIWHDAMLAAMNGLPDNPLGFAPAP
ncbi:transglycosylase domain-containing protein [Streptacidiphilus jiangxiensis]|uniref:Membrane carboxypeptidase (Penicillin-binding protein) n=1 Tax=Streptacidiphilus jiangxiensis TaxID=235985 RepID=A0A1H7ULR4_STRJI|nr:transglycosylase domain-containing protein [Streptacidiphilus jiangxiensis]SEL97257.1 Membrane carboxypeptidase (penicillin-binding protein) [Streptacidiphilus jiangxiensis]